jgi:hypothetical protein
MVSRTQRGKLWMAANTVPSSSSLQACANISGPSFAMSGSDEHYRTKADECRQKTARASSPIDKISLAKDWQKRRSLAGAVET